MSDQEVITKKTTKKTLSQKQKDALARGRAKRLENIKNGIKTERKKKINTKSDDYLAGLIRGIEMDRRIVKLENKAYGKAYDLLTENGLGIEDLPYKKKNVKQYSPKKISEKQKDALARGRERASANRQARKANKTNQGVVE